jgi:hypothetical protein
VQPVADAIRRAMVQRGVQVFILTTEEGLNENASYVKSLSLAGANVRWGYTNMELMILDRSFVIAGPLISMALRPLDTEPTILVGGGSYAQQMTEAFVMLFGYGTPFDPRVTVR